MQMSTARSDKHCPVVVLREPITDFKPEGCCDIFSLHQAEEYGEQEMQSSINVPLGAIQGSHKAELKKRLFQEKELIKSHLPSFNRETLAEVQAPESMYVTQKLRKRDAKQKLDAPTKRSDGCVVRWNPLDDDKELVSGDE